MSNPAPEDLADIARAEAEGMSARCRHFDAMDPADCVNCNPPPAAALCTHTRVDNGRCAVCDPPAPSPAPSHPGAGRPIHPALALAVAAVRRYGAAVAAHRAEPNALTATDQDDAFSAVLDALDELVPPVLQFSPPLILIGLPPALAEDMPALHAYLDAAVAAGRAEVRS